MAQAAMQHSNMSLTMNVYSDAKLLHTASAVESLPTFELGSVAPAVASTTDRPCHLVSISGTKTSMDKRGNANGFPVISLEKNSRAGGIRTHDLYHPKQERTAS